MLEASFCEDRGSGEMDVIVDLGNRIGKEPEAMRTALEEVRSTGKHPLALCHAVEKRPEEMAEADRVRAVVSKIKVDVQNISGGADETGGKA